MVDPSWKTAEISTFRGVRSYMDNTEGDIEQALEALMATAREPFFPASNGSNP